MTPPRKHDWLSMRAQYVEGVSAGEKTLWPTYDELAARFTVDVRQIRHRAAKEGWTDQRTAFQRRIELQRQNERSAEIARVGADLDVAAIRIAKDGLAVTNARLQDIGIQTQNRVKAMTALQRRFDGAAIPADEQRKVDSEYPAVDPLTIERVSRSAQEFYLLGTRAIGQAPKLTVELETDLDLADDVRDQRALAMLSIVKDHLPDLLPQGLEDVIDIDEGRLQIAAGGSPNGHVDDLDPEDE